MSLLNAFKYKQWANQEILRFGAEQLSSLNAEDATFFIRILNHTAVVDHLFIQRVIDKPDPFDADNTPETPSLDELQKRMSESDAWLIDYVATISDDELKRVISFTFTDGEKGQLSVEEILLHLLTHGSNHRGMASRTLAVNGLERPKDTFTRFLHLIEPQRRGE